MDTDEKLALVLRNTEEVVTKEEVAKLLEEKENPTAYIGFEPSGFVHIAQGMICARKIKDLQKAGFTVKIFLADWHAFINDKLGGKMENIRTAGEYMKDAFLSLGIDPERTEFVWASDIIITPDYWEKVLRIAKVSSLARVRRALTIMGRKESEVETDVSKLIYPPMQAADIFQLGVDVAYGGMDQRKAHMLARDAAEKLGWRKPIALHTPLLSGLKGGGRMDSSYIRTIDNLYYRIKNLLDEMDEADVFKPHELTYGQESRSNIINKIKNDMASFTKKDSINYFFSNKDIDRFLDQIKKISNSIDTKLENENRGIGYKQFKKWYDVYFNLRNSYMDLMADMKMSKSDPDSSILIHDSPEDIRRKLKKAYCPEGTVEGNPVMDIAKHIVFPQKGHLLIERPEKWGGNLEFQSYDELESVFMAKELHPTDLKNGVASALIELLEPARKYFEKHAENLNRLKEITEKKSRAGENRPKIRKNKEKR